MKTCMKCNVQKPLTDFYKTVNGDRNGVMACCKDCHYDYGQKYKKKHRERLNKIERERYRKNPDMKRNQKFKSRYGLTLEQYNKLVALQEKRCSICDKITKLYVDHDHTTGEVRELLCTRCNTAVGMVFEDLKIAQSLASYLMRHKT